jgi:serine/threonine protein kinase
MGALCSTARTSSVNFEPSHDFNDYIRESQIREPEICEPITSYQLGCDIAGSYGCFTVLDNDSYRNLLRFANDNKGSIKVKNEYKKPVFFEELVKWLNPDDPINGACKFIKPILTEDQRKDLFNNNITEFDYKESEIDIYNEVVQEEINSALLLARIFGKGTEDFINYTTYRPYDDACVFTIILPRNVVFTYKDIIEYKVDETVTPVKRTKYKYSIKMRKVVLIMNKKCSGDLYNLIFTIKPALKLNTTKMMNDIGPFIAKLHYYNITHFDLKLENIFVCDGKYTIGDYGTLRQNRIKLDENDIATYMFPSYGFTQEPAVTIEEKKEREALMKKWLNISNGISKYYPTDYNLPSPDLKPDPYNLYYYMLTVPSYLKKIGIYEHAKYVDRYALALAIIYGLYNTKLSNFDEKIIKDLLDYKQEHYFEKLYIIKGGNSITSKVSKLTLKPMKSVSIKKNLQKTQDKIKYNGYNYVIYLTPRNKKVIFVKNEKIYVDKINGGGKKKKKAPSKNK